MTQEAPGRETLPAALTLRRSVCDFAGSTGRTRCEAGLQSFRSTGISEDSGVGRVIDSLRRSGARSWPGAALWVAVTAACAGLTATAAPPTLVGKEAPDFALKGIDGQNLRLSEYRGRVVLVNFWARWAGDSRQEITALEQIDTTYRRAGLVVLGVSMDEDARRAGDYAHGLGVSYPILFDPGAALGHDYL